MYYTSYCQDLLSGQNKITGCLNYLKYISLSMKLAEAEPINSCLKGRMHLIVLLRNFTDPYLSLIDVIYCDIFCTSSRHKNLVSNDLVSIETFSWSSSRMSHLKGWHKGIIVSLTRPANIACLASIINQSDPCTTPRLSTWGSKKWPCDFIVYVVSMAHKLVF